MAQLARDAAILDPLERARVGNRRLIDSEFTTRPGGGRSSASDGKISALLQLQQA